jgi:mRNA interferase HigB
MFRVISKKKFVEFWGKHPESEKTMQEMHHLLRHCNARNFSELKQTFNSVDIVGRRTVFDVHGNKYRVVARVNYDPGRTIHVLGVFTHQEYDKWTKDNRRK